MAQPSDSVCAHEWEADDAGGRSFTCPKCGADQLRWLEARVVVLESVIEVTNNVLFDADPHDIEHTIECHADTLPAEFRRVGAGVQQALNIVGAIVAERF